MPAPQKPKLVDQIDAEILRHQERVSAAVRDSLAPEQSDPQEHVQFETELNRLTIELQQNVRGLIVRYFEPIKQKIAHVQESGCASSSSEA